MVYDYYVVITNIFDQVQLQSAVRQVCEKCKWPVRGSVMLDYTKWNVPHSPGVILPTWSSSRTEQSVNWRSGTVSDSFRNRSDQLALSINMDRQFETDNLVSVSLSDVGVNCLTTWRWWTTERRMCIATICTVWMPSGLWMGLSMAEWMPMAGVTKIKTCNRNASDMLDIDFCRWMWLCNVLPAKSLLINGNKIEAYYYLLFEQRGCTSSRWTEWKWSFGTNTQW